MTTDVLCFGELLVDCLQTGTSTEDGITLQEFRHYPGGAPANVAVAVAKLGGRAGMFGQVGADQFGRWLTGIMEHYGVSTRYLMTHDSASTAMAFITLDSDGERRFEFYRQNTADLLIQPDQIDRTMFANQPIVHFCSNTLTDPQMVTTTRLFVELAQKQGCLTSFDVNLRHNLWVENKADSELILDLAAGVDVLKVSREELDYLCPQGEEAFARKLLGAGVKVIVVTDAGNPVKLLGKGMHSVIQVPEIKVVDTTAAGDAFVGGFLYGLSLCEDIRASLNDPSAMETITHFACVCGGRAASASGAFTSLPTEDDVADHFVEPH